MIRSRSLLTGTAIAALTMGLSVGVAGTAQAAPAVATAPAHATAAVAPTYSWTFNLLVPNAPVTFTVNGAVVATGTTDTVGDVSVSYSPAGLAPGQYSLVATTDYGISSSVAFGVR